MADKTHDTLVIGAGVIGLACAFRLARGGRRVLLLDRAAPGMGASFGNAGHIATEQVFPLASPAVIGNAWRYLIDRDGPLRLRAGYALPILPWLARFAWASRPGAFARGTTALAALQQTAARDLAALLQEAGAAQLLHLDGHLVLVERTTSVAAAQGEQAALRRLGVASDWLDAAAAKAIAPDIAAPIAGGMRFYGSGHVDDPHAVCTVLFDAFRAAGGAFRQTTIEEVEAASAGVAARGADGQWHHAAQLVLACGAWSAPLAAQLGFRLPLDTERGYHLTLPGAAPRFCIPVASFERKVIMTPMSMGLRMTGTVEFGGLALPPDPHRFDLLRQHLRALVPAMAIDGATTWMGFRPSLPDHLPVLGRAPGQPRVHFAFGHQHLGLTLAGVTARIVADQLAGRGSGIDLAPFAADRF